MATVNEQVDGMLGKDDPLALEVGWLIEHNNLFRGASAFELRSKLLRDSSMLASVQAHMPRASGEGSLTVELSRQSGIADMQPDSLFSVRRCSQQETCPMQLAEVSVNVREQASYWSGCADCLSGEIALALHAPDAE